ncbi:hypothetical protein WH47_01824 [Habropoda laboriosa]|uniref:Uncharacterized protein n=1 Tax=Habropoda laboriosa TaxID=597456 RepID=A0A0L7QTP5_9HYME|nr:hypothetical protein WH47_01824 [Habropoda laboriosa]
MRECERRREKWLKRERERERENVKKKAWKISYVRIYFRLQRIDQNVDVKDINATCVDDHNCQKGGIDSVKREPEIKN